MTVHAGPRGRSIASNVNAELKRQRMTTRSLLVLGGSYSYWQRRTSGDLPFNAEYAP